MNRMVEKITDIKYILEDEINILTNIISCPKFLGYSKIVVNKNNILKCSTRKCRLERQIFNDKPFFNLKLNFVNIITVINLYMKIMLRISNKVHEDQKVYIQDHKRSLQKN